MTLADSEGNELSVDTSAEPVPPAPLPRSSGPSRSLLAEKESTIASLQSEIVRLQNSLAGLTGKIPSSDRAANSANLRRARTQPLHAHTIQGAPGSASVPGSFPSPSPLLQGVPVRSPLGRHASVETVTALDALQKRRRRESKGAMGPEEEVYGRVLAMFRDPKGHVSYLWSEAFARDLLELCERMKPRLEEEPRVVFLQSPCYVFGDLHGNLEDLHFFSDNVWRLGMSLTAGNFVFLGDYVDRGMCGLEVVAYLMVMKLSLPNKVHLLRGNHETRDCNGWQEYYGERSYIAQCQTRFGSYWGFRIWEETNKVFDRLPLAAVVDQEIFCTHGGIPRSVAGGRSEVEQILGVPSVAGINPPYEHEGKDAQQIASDCIWSDPATQEQELHEVDPETGFGQSRRGGGCVCFGNKAVTNFLSRHNYSFILRAHEAHAEGVAISKGARVFTVFSTSKDHHQGNQAMAGCILVDTEKMQVINRSPAYRDRYVHRRGSVSLAGMSVHEIEKAAQLGLVTEQPQEEFYQDCDINEDDEAEEEEQGEGPIYKLDTGRESAVNPGLTVPTPHDHNKSFFGDDKIDSSEEEEKEDGNHMMASETENMNWESTSTSDNSSQSAGKKGKKANVWRLLYS